LNLIFHKKTGRENITVLRGNIQERKHKDYILLTLLAVLVVHFLPAKKSTSYLGPHASSSSLSSAAADDDDDDA